jgi:hypothetical protein
MNKTEFVMTLKNSKAATLFNQSINPEVCDATEA